MRFYLNGWGSVVPSFNSFINDWKNENIHNLRNQFKYLAASHPKRKFPLPKPMAMSLEGGGPRGKVYISGIETLDELSIIEHLQTVVGTSVGAIFAFLIGMGFTPKQIREISDTINFKDLLDARPTGIAGDWWEGTWIKKGSSLIFGEYAHSGDIFHNWASYLVEEILGDPNASFADLHQKVISGEDPLLKDLIFTAVHSKHDTPQEFSFETTPNVRIADALQASMTLPGIFQVRVVKNKDGSEFGRFVDGGVRINNPLNLLDKPRFVDPHYPMQSTKEGSQVINPSVMGLSLSWLYKLDEEITPINGNVRKEINDYKKEHDLSVRLQSGSVSLMQLCQKKFSDIKAFLQHYKFKYWKNYDLGDIFRHIWYFNIGFLQPNKENRAQKHKDHIPNAIQFWNLDIAPHELQFTDKQKKRADIVGRETVYSWWDKWHRPMTTYEGHYVKLARDLKKSQLAVYLREIEQELSHYQKSALRARGYHPKDYLKNVRLTFLCKQVVKILEKNPHPNKTLQEAFNSMQNELKARQKKITKQTVKRDCYQFAFACQKMTKAIELDDVEKFKRVYYSQLGKGLQLLSNPLLGKDKTLIELIIGSGSPAMLKTALFLADQTIHQAYQNGQEPLFKNISQLLTANSKRDIHDLVEKRQDPSIATIISTLCPKLFSRHKLLLNQYKGEVNKQDVGAKGELAKARKGGMRL